jgi:prevent-host-death family protein
MATVNIAEAKAQFSRLVQRAMMGEEVIIARDNKPVVKLVPVDAPSKPRKPGSAKGQIWISPDFDEVPDDFGDYR